MIAQITPVTLPVGLDLILAAQGLRRFGDTRVMALDDVPVFKAHSGTPVTIEPIGLEAFAQRVGASRASPLAHRQAQAERTAWAH